MSLPLEKNPLMKNMTSFGLKAKEIWSQQTYVALQGDTGKAASNFWPTGREEILGTERSHHILIQEIKLYVLEPESINGVSYQEEGFKW